MEHYTKPKNNGIQVLRALAFISVLFQHCSVARTATWGVSMFFCISGFVLVYASEYRMISCGIKENIRFGIDHIKRLWPLHIIVLGFAMILELYGMYAEGRTDILLEIKRFLLQAFLLHAWDKSGIYRDALNGPTWFLSAALFLYFLFPCVINCIKRIKTKYLAAISFLIFVIQLVLTYIIGNSENVFYYTYFFPPYRCFEFFQGCILAKLFLSRDIQAKHNALWTIFGESGIIIANLVVICLANSPYRADVWIENSIYYQPFVLGLIWAFAGNSGMITKCFTNRFWSG